MNRSVMKFTSELGCTIRAIKAPDHLGDGVLLELRMEQDGDGRRAEVYLSESDVLMLKFILTEVSLSDPLPEWE